VLGLSVMGSRGSIQPIVYGLQQSLVECPLGCPTRLTMAGWVALVTVGTFQVRPTVIAPVHPRMNRLHGVKRLHASWWGMF
jgi:hypothetical protein